MADDQPLNGPLFGYHFSPPGQEINFPPTGESAAPAGPSILSQEDSHQVRDFFTHTPFWPDSSAVQADANAQPFANPYGIYQLPEVHDVSMQSPYTQAELNHLAFLGSGHPEAMGTMGTMGTMGIVGPMAPPTSSLMLPSSGDMSHVLHAPLQLASAPPALRGRVAIVTDHAGMPSLGYDCSSSEHSPQSNTISPSPTMPGQATSTHPVYDMPASIGDSMPTYVSDARYRPAVQFGTDSRFASSGFTGPESLELNRDYNRKISDAMKYFERRPSADASLPESPICKRPANQIHELAMMSQQPSDPKMPAKRQKRNSEPDMQERNGKTALVRSSKTPPRKKKAGPRQNLTDEQRRENHIKSEQKRRDAIKDGFITLRALIPNPKTQKLSKAEQLGEAIDFLNDLLAGNEHIRQALLAQGIDSNNPGSPPEHRVLQHQQLVLLPPPPPPPRPKPNSRDEQQQLQEESQEEPQEEPQEQPQELLSQELLSQELSQEQLQEQSLLLPPALMPPLALMPIEQQQA